MQYPSFEQMMTDLIAAPSVSSVSPAWDQSNEAVVQLLADWCRDAGFRTEVMPLPRSPGKFNLVASMGRGPGGLVLSGHTDTVPFDAGRWSSDPFRLHADGDRWHGLGTADMKGFFAFVLEAVRGLDLAHLQHPLILVATADEESSMCGAQALQHKLPELGRHAVIGEPTNLRPIRMHKGIAMEAVRVLGSSGHSSNPALGDNALDGMHAVLDELIHWRGELRERHHNPAFEVAWPTLNLGHVHGGDNPNRICAECELHFDIRPLPGMSLDALREEIDRRLAARLADSGLRLERHSLFGGIDAMETPEDAAIVRAAEELTGHAAEAVAFGTEGPYFNAVGLDTIILGPGSIDQAHQPDEFLSLDQVNPGIGLLQALIHRFCVTA